MLGGITIADTTSGYRMLEMSHPPNYYFPPADIRSDALEPEVGTSWCEWKGQAHYYMVRAAERNARPGGLELRESDSGVPRVGRDGRVRPSADGRVFR